MSASAFDEVNAALLPMARTIVPEWIPGGTFSGSEYLPANPNRPGDRPNSAFKINLNTLVWKDFAGGSGAAGYGLVSLYRYVHSLTPGEALRQLAEKYNIQLPPNSNGAGAGKRKGLTLAEYANKKGFPTQWLREMGLREVEGKFGLVVELPYAKLDGSPARRQIRHSMRAKKNTYWAEGGGEIVPAGIDGLQGAEQRFFVEGYSDFLTLRLHNVSGVIAFPGAGTIKSLLRSEYLEGVKVVCISCEPGGGGTDFLRDACDKLREFGFRGEAKAIRWPGKGLKDPNDLHRQNPNAFDGALAKLLETAEKLDLSPDRREQIFCHDMDLASLTPRAWEVLQRRNDPPSMFRYGRSLVRVESDDKGRPIAVNLGEWALRNELSRGAIWKVTTTASTKIIVPPRDLLRDLLADRQKPLPVLRRITTTPVFDSIGALIDRPGYYPDSGILYIRDAELVMDRLPRNPSTEDIRSANRLIDDELLTDFLFTNDSDRAHAKALMLLPAVRDMITGCTPAARIESPIPGTGKGLLGWSLLYPTFGETAISAQVRDDEELRKAITACVSAMRPYFWIDNVTRRLESGELAAAITATTWNARRLGGNDATNDLVYPMNLIWVLTGNNLLMTRELYRRSLRIRIDSGIERPELRSGFRHESLREWVRANRADLLRAILILAQAWIVAGRPKPKVTPLGSFEDWTYVVGGILENAGIQGFLADFGDDTEVVDSDGAIWAEIVDKWWAQYKTAAVGTAELFEIAKETELSLGRKDSDRSQRTALGAALRAKRDCVVSGYRIKYAGDSHGAAQWRLGPISGARS